MRAQRLAHLEQKGSEGSEGSQDNSDARGKGGGGSGLTTRRGERSSVVEGALEADLSAGEHARASSRGSAVLLVLDVCGAVSVDNGVALIGGPVPTSVVVGVLSVLSSSATLVGELPVSGVVRVVKAVGVVAGVGAEGGGSVDGDGRASNILNVALAGAGTNLSSGEGAVLVGGVRLATNLEELQEALSALDVGHGEGQGEGAVLEARSGGTVNGVGTQVQVRDVIKENVAAVTSTGAETEGEGRV